MSPRPCILVPLSLIRPTEEVCPLRSGEVLAMIRDSRAWTRPICIECSVGALLDGHHRFAAARALGMTRVPVHVFDYDEVDLASWRPDFMPTRADVVARAISGDLYPAKTTRHTFAAHATRPILMSALIDRASSSREFSSGDVAPLSSVRFTRCAARGSGNRGRGPEPGASPPDRALPGRR